MQSTGKVINFNQIRQAPKNPPNNKKPKILFVDDEERILNTMKALFRRQYDTTTTTDGYHALELLKQDHYQLLVSDQRMPIMAGVDLLREAKKVSPHTIRILLTGYSDLTAIIGSVNEGEVFRFLNKPWDTQEFINTVDEAVKIGQELQAANDPAALLPLSTEDLDKQQANTLATEPRIIATPEKTPAPSESSESINTHNDNSNDNILVLHSEPQILASIRSALPGYQIFSAGSHDAAIDLMLEHEIGVIVSNIDDDHEGALAFFALLKSEHPQVVSILLANSGDSTTLIDLINHARVFRYMFKPIRERLLERYLHSAIEQYQKFKVAPTLLKQQKAQDKPLLSESPLAEIHSATNNSGKTKTPLITQNKSGVLGKMRKIRSFFSRLVSG